MNLIAVTLVPHLHSMLVFFSLFLHACILSPCNMHSFDIFQSLVCVSVFSSSFLANPFSVSSSSPFPLLSCPTICLIRPYWFLVEQKWPSSILTEYLVHLKKPWVKQTGSLCEYLSAHVLFILVLFPRDLKDCFCFFFPPMCFYPPFLLHYILRVMLQNNFFELICHDQSLSIKYEMLSALSCVYYPP